MLDIIITSSLWTSIVGTAATWIEDCGMCQKTLLRVSLVSKAANGRAGALAVSLELSRYVLLYYCIIIISYDCTVPY